jgi:hypothetical protein
LKKAFLFLTEDEDRYHGISQKTKEYVREHMGATEAIMKSIP